LIVGGQGVDSDGGRDPAVLTDDDPLDAAADTPMGSA
jgi:hypothetical protein